MTATFGNAVSGMVPHSKSRAAKIIGILNIVFATIYGAIGIVMLFTAINAWNQVRVVDPSPLAPVERVASRAINLVVFLGLLASGLELLKERARGRLLLQATAIVLATYVLLETTYAAAMMVALPPDWLPPALVAFFLGLVMQGIRVAYPIIASLVLSSSPERLGLR